MEPLDGDVLSREHVGKLLAHGGVLGCFKVSTDEVLVSKAEGKGHGLGVALVFAVDLVCGAEEHGIVGRNEKVDAADHVQADSCIGILVDELWKLVDRLELEQEIDRIGFCIVCETEWNDLKCERQELVCVLVICGAGVVFLTELCSEVAHVLVTPEARVFGLAIGCNWLASRRYWRVSRLPLSE